MKQSVSDIVKEVQEYERLREVREQCGQTTVQAVNCLVLNGGLHSGTVVHKCTLRKEHAEVCRCGACGHQWLSR